MKLTITQADLQQAVAEYLEKFNLSLDPSQLVLDTYEVEVTINPVTEQMSEVSEKPKRTRRTRAEIEAEREEQNAKASLAIDDNTASTRTVETSEFDEDEEPQIEEEEEEDVLAAIVDEVAPDTVTDKPKTPQSIFG